MSDESHLLRDATFRQLRALSAVAQSGSYTAAAQAIGVTQPAVSLQIQTLQDRAGLPLFERVNGALAPTDAGALLIATAQQIEVILSDASRQLAAMRAGQGGQVSIGAVSTAKYFVPFAISSFQRANPEIDVRLIIGNRGDILAMLRDNKLHLAIIGRPPDDLVLESRKMGDHPHVVIADPRHPFVARGRIPLADLARETFVVREIGSGTRTLMERYFAQNAFSARIGMEIASNETIKQAVMAGLGVAFISGHVVAAEVADGRLAVLPVEGLPLLREWFVARRPERALLPVAERMYDYLAEDGRRHLPKLDATTSDHRRSCARPPGVA